MANAAQLPPTCKAVRLNSTPVIDGKVSEEEWTNASVIDSFLDRQTSQPPAKDLTKAYLGYTKEAIYVAFMCYDSEPDRIIGREVQPNAEFRGEDKVTISFNMFGNRSFEQLSEFIVNSIGTQTEKIAGGRSGKREWRGAWKAATSKDDQGWYCEMMIPWSILNYPDKKSINVDLNLFRFQGRTLFEQSWANYRPNPLPELQGIWTDVEPPEPPKPKPQYLVYAASEAQKGTTSIRSGLDAKLPLSNTLSALVTVAPDFRNIEDVIAGNDFVRTERFLNDPRPFFLEGSSFFELNDRFSYGRMFYSRRISDFDIGAKTFGQITPNLAIGALYTNNIDGNKAAVVKLTNTVSGTQTQKVYATQSLRNGVENSAIGFGFFKRWDTLSFNIESSAEQNRGEDWDTAGAVSVRYIRPNITGRVQYSWIEKTYEPGLGLLQWTNRRGVTAFINANRQWRTGSLRDYQFTVFANEYRTFDTNQIQEGGISINGEIATRSDLGLGVSLTRQTFLGKVDDYKSYSVTFNKSNRFRRLGFTRQEGIQNDLPSRYYALDASWRIANALDIGLRRSVLELDGTSQQTIFTALYQVSADTTISSRVATTDGGTNAYLSFRKAGNAGTEYYLILGDPNAQTTQTRLALKLVWAF